MNMRSRILLVAAVVLTGACGEREEAATAGTADTAATAVSAGNIEVALSDSGLALSSESVRAGDTQVTIRNHGEYSHGIVVRGNGFEQKIQGVAPGTQTVLTIDLKPGTYELSCPLNDARGDHAASGERATLTVTK